MIFFVPDVRAYFGVGTRASAWTSSRVPSPLQSASPASTISNWHSGGSSSWLTLNQAKYKLKTIPYKLEILSYFSSRILVLHTFISTFLSIYVYKVQVYEKISNFNLDTNKCPKKVYIYNIIRKYLFFISWFFHISNTC